MELKQYAELVQKARKAQKDYFKIARSGGFGRDVALQTSKELERELDKVTNEILTDTGVQQVAMFE